MNPDYDSSRTNWRKPSPIYPTLIDIREAKIALRKVQRAISGLEALEKVEMAIGITKCATLRLDIGRNIKAAAKELIRTLRFDD